MNTRSITNFDFSGGLHELLSYAVRVQSIGDFVFFRLILSYLRKRIDQFGIELLGNMMSWVGGIALTLMTLWVLIQGFRIVTGRSRDSMMVLVTNMARAALIVSVATSMAMFGGSLKNFLVKDLKNEITYVVTGKNESPEDQIDKSLAWMQVGLSSIDAINVLNDGNLRDDKNRALWAVGIGTGGPAVTAGSMLLLYEVALALFIGLGPLFILCLLFEQTKTLFQKWLFYGIGTGDDLDRAGHGDPRVGIVLGQCADREVPAGSGRRREHDQPSAAAGRHGPHPHYAYPNRAPNGCDVLPRNHG